LEWATELARVCCRRLSRPAVPERNPVVPGHEKSVLECAGPYVGVGELVEREPADLQVVFLTGGFRVGDGDLEHEVEFVTSDVVFDIAVLNNADDPGVGTEFFGDLADEGYLNALTRLNMPAGHK
jgi:hypothetical protein